MDRLLKFSENPNWAFFIKYLILFTLFFISVASISLLVVLKEEIKPFFYAAF
jgi:hypothetical protein